MSSFHPHSRFAFVFVLFLALGGVLIGQTPDGESGAAKSKLAEFIKSKGSAQPFVLLTPSDLAWLGRSELSRLMGDPCETAVQINLGDTVNGALTSGDCRLDDSSYADFYVFNGTQGQQVTIDLGSTAFNTYLGLANQSGTFVLEDDNGGGGTNSRITATLPETGLYVILANSYLPNSFGAYTLSLSGCTFALTPTGADIPGVGGTFTFNVTTQAGCYWGAVSQSSFITVNSPGGVPGSQTVSYTVQSNITGATRTGTIRVKDQVFTVTQVGITCTYSISPTSADHSPDPATSQFTMNTPQGCPWTASYNGFWLFTTNETKIGPGPVVYTVAANNGGDRTGTITVAGNTFTVRQAGRNCTYSFTPTSVQLTYERQTGYFSVDTQPGCTWSFSGAFNYIYFPNGYGGTGPGTLEYGVYQNFQFPARSWNVQFNGLATTNIAFTQNGFPNRRRFDFDGDGLADRAVWRPSNNTWYLARTTAGYTAMSWGGEGDLPAPADYDGDLKTDIAVFRPSTGKWYVVNSSNMTFAVYSWGQAGDLPVPADYNGDGKADLIVFRELDGTWYKRSAATGEISTRQFGEAGDKPVVGDFDADGLWDVVVYRPSNHNWYLAKSTAGYFVQTWGENGDVPVPADYDGDGKTDIAVFRPSLGRWYISASTNGFYTVNWGQAGDVPVAADYDGDGKSDPAVFRPSESRWYLNQSSAGLVSLPFGEAGDVPAQSVFQY